MRTLRATLKSTSPYSQGRFYRVDKANGGKESAKDYEERTWRERLHYDQDGKVFIPPMAFKNCIAEAAKYLSIQVPGKGKATYTKHFEAGLLVIDGLTLGIKKDDVPGQWLFVPADGKRGGGKRVEKCFPLIQAWSGDVDFIVVDETLMDEHSRTPGGRIVTVFEHVLREAGRYIGIGVFRPRNNGFYGRFDVLDVSEI